MSARFTLDLLHPGHVASLEAAAELGQRLVVGINSDASVRANKGPTRPVMTELDRAKMLAALECVDAVTIFDEDTLLDIVRTVRPQVLVKGQDYTLKNVVGRELVEADGGRVLLVPLMAAKSTSALIEHIRRSQSSR